MVDKNLIEVKNAKQAKKPSFLQRNRANKRFARVSGKWKKPRGSDNKLRRKRKGIGSWVMTGFKMPRALRGYTRQGLEPVEVANLAEIKALNKDAQVAIIRSGVGKKSKVVMLKEATKLGITVVNVKDPAAFVKQCEEEMAQRKQKAKKTVAAKKEPAKKEKKEDKGIEALATEDKKKEDKKKLDKILTKKE